MKSPDTKFVDQNGNSALHSAAKFGKILWNHSISGSKIITKICVYFLPGQEKIAQLLIENGADVDGTNDFGKAPIHLASQRGYLYIKYNDFNN